MHRGGGGEGGRAGGRVIVHGDPSHQKSDSSRVRVTSHTSLMHSEILAILLSA